MVKIKTEEVDYIYVEEVTFSVVMKDGSDVVVSEKGISMDTYSKEQLSDNVLAHLEQNLPVEILDDDEDIITFEPDINLRETEEFVTTIEDKIVEEEHSQVSQDIADEILSHGCPNGNCDV